MLILRLTARLKTPKLLPQNPSAVYRRRTLMTLPPFSLEGKTCVVTDAARSLGREFLTAFASSGAKGACVDLFHSAAESLIKTICEHAYKTSGIGLKLPEEDLEISSPQPDLRGYACDVTSEQDVKKTFASILDDISKIDVVVIAADIVENFEAENHEYHKWKKMLDVNFKGSWLWAREAGAPYGIRVNALSPGYTKSDLIIGLLENEGKHIVKNWIKDIPMGRMAHPSELQGTIVWMASDASSYLNGSDIVVDGGYTSY